MFDLEKSIAEWRRQMLAAGIKSPVPLDELEIHLREDLERRLEFGLSAQTAFPVAVERIGQGNLLKMEFKKVDGLDKPQRRRIVLIYAFIIVFYSFALIYILCKNDLSFDERLLGFSAVATALLSDYAALRFAHRFFPIVTSRRHQSAIGLIGGISGMSWFLAFAYLILPRCNFTPDQLLVAVLWALVPVIVLPTITFIGLEKSEDKQFTTHS
jgi:hypothetical protein